MIVDVTLGANGGGDSLQSGEGFERFLRGFLEAALEGEPVVVSAQDQGDVALLGEQQIRLVHQLRQDRFRTAVPALPQFRPVVAIERDRYPAGSRRAHGSQCGFCRCGAHGRGDSRQMQPAVVGERHIPVDEVGRRQGERGVGSVVKHFRRAVSGADRQEVQTHPARPELNRFRVHAVSPDLSQSGVSQRIFGKDGDE